MLVEFQYVRTSHDFLVFSPITYDVNAPENIVTSSIFPLNMLSALMIAAFIPIAKSRFCCSVKAMVNVEMAVPFNAPSIYKEITPKLFWLFSTVTSTLYHTPVVNGIFGPDGNP
jgi:hypothetical protein